MGLEDTVWDVVIVGAGSAGAVLAARLSEGGRRRVLVLEAGPDYPAADSPPELDGVDPLVAIGNPDYADLQWQGLNAWNTATQSLRPYPRGRGVGGTSAINGRIALRPPLDEFDAWEVLGGPQWSRDRVLETFIALEDDELYGDAAYHGRGGPNPIVHQTEELWSSIDEVMHGAALEQGLPWHPDCNAPGATGISHNAFTGRAGARIDTAHAYLEPARARENLAIRGGALVDRVRFDGTGRATGVQAVIDGEPVEIEAGEVILAAGAIHSPAILQRSGIGPAAVLRAAGIEPRVESPVGEGLQEHPAVAVALPAKVDGYRPPGLLAWALMVRYSSGVGADTDANDILISSFAPASLEGFPFVLFGGEMMRSHSTGTVRIRSADPARHPEIDLRMLSDPRDMERMKTMLARTRELIAAPAMARIAAGEPLPAQLTWGGMPDMSASFADLESDAALGRWLLATAHTSQHPTSTCALGAVVDGDGAALGVDGLRVIDASITPVVPRANTNLTVIMLAEHIARRLDPAGSPALAGHVEG